MNIAFGILFVTVFFYAVSFTLAIGYDDAALAYRENISALALAAQLFPAGVATILGVVLNLFAVTTAFFGVFLGFEEACRGLLLNALGRFVPQESLSRKAIDRGIRLFLVVLAWFVVTCNFPVLNFTSLSSPIFGLIGCLIPAWLVWQVPALARYRKPSLALIVLTGLLLLISPFLNFVK